MSQTDYLSKIFFDGLEYFDPFGWKKYGKKKEDWWVIKK